MCSAEEEPALGHSGVAFRSASDGRKYLVRSCGDLQFVLPSKRRCGSHLPVHPGTIFGGMRPSGTFPSFLLSGSGIRWRFLLLGGFGGWEQQRQPGLSEPSASPTPHTGEQTFRRLLGMYPGISTPGEPSK